jgi:hypothetical protein
MPNLLAVFTEPSLSKLSQAEVYPRHNGGSKPSPQEILILIWRPVSDRLRACMLSKRVTYICHRYSRTCLNVSDPNGQPSLSNAMGNPYDPSFLHILLNFDRLAGLYRTGSTIRPFVYNGSFVYAYNHACRGTVISEDLGAYMPNPGVLDLYLPHEHVAVSPWKEGLKRQQVQDYDAPGKRFSPGCKGDNCSDMGGGFWVGRGPAASV